MTTSQRTTGQRTTSQRQGRRRGAVLVMTALLLIFFLGLVACAFDLGWIVMTRTELQAAADAAALAGGTELMAGLGLFATATPSEVEAAGRTAAVTFAGENPNGDVLASFADENRDVRFGWAVYDDTTQSWIKTWGATGPNTGYNMIGVTLHRDQTATTNDDGQLPLFIGPVLGRNHKGLQATATAVILPANGFRVTPGDPTTADIIPFAMSKQQYDKYLVAQDYYGAGGTANPAGGFPANLDPANGGPWYRAPSGEPGDYGDPLFGHYIVKNGKTTFVQDFNDLFNVTAQSEPDSGFTSGPDQILEVDLYPRDDVTSGNFGTIDLGDPNNSTSELSRQIEYGLNEYDLSFFDNNEIVLPLGDVNGDTGVSAGLKHALEKILGQCRGIALFDHVSGPGNNAGYDLYGWAGLRLVEVELNGALQYKHLRFQLCQFSGAGGVGDPTETVDENTTVFTPLILIE